MTAAVKIEFVDRLTPVLTKPKRLKIIVGGRASTKSTSVSDYVLAKVASGQTWGCGREYQNTVDESVHSMLKDEIERLEIPGFSILKTEIAHLSGGRTFYRGLARNIASLKALVCDGFWIEEGETLSQETIKVLFASIRASALEQDKAKKEGRDIKFPEIIITMNRGSSKDAISKHCLARAERELERCGYYEDEFMMVVELNYYENPWFLGSGLETERADDEKHLSRTAYEHKWLGKYSDTVENAIIEPDWFDACIDAHEILGFKPEGLEVVVHDPFDGGEDAAALVYMHGVVVLDAQEKRDGRVNDACDWALDYAINRKPDVFIWDAGGIGAGLKRQITDALATKKISIQSFEGQASVDLPESPYEPAPGTVHQAKTNKQMYFNRRAQRYWELRDRIFRTYLAVQDKKYTDPSKLISFSSKVSCLKTLRAELCRIPTVPDGAGKIKIMSKDKMKAEGIDSPNIGDCVMMAGDAKSPFTKFEPFTFTSW